MNKRLESHSSKPFYNELPWTLSPKFQQVFGRTDLKVMSRRVFIAELPRIELKPLEHVQRFFAYFFVSAILRRQKIKRPDILPRRCHPGYLHGTAPFSTTPAN